MQPLSMQISELLAVHEIMDISFADKAVNSVPHLVKGYTRHPYQVSCILHHSLWRIGIHTHLE
jgi:hypothetical protein